MPCSTRRLKVSACMETHDHIDGSLSSAGGGHDRCQWPLADVLCDRRLLRVYDRRYLVLTEPAYKGTAASGPPPAADTDTCFELIHTLPCS